MMLKATVFLSLVALSEASKTHIAGFRPETNVADHNAIDLDQYAINDEMSKKHDSSFANAREIYQKGGNSKTIAKLKLQLESLSYAIAKGTQVTGTGVNGQSTGGTVYKNSPVSGTDGEIELEVQYDIRDDNVNHLGCKVGGLGSNKVTDECFKEEGIVTVGAVLGDVSYKYVVEEDNYNARTIQGFSTGFETRMKPQDPGTDGLVLGADGWFIHFQKFIDYYGEGDYGDIYVMAALDKKPTGFTKGNSDFRNVGNDARAQAVKKGTAYMVIAMYVIRELEDAVDDCLRGCDEDACNDDAVHALDEAVAFYTGSREGTTMTMSSGNMMYNLADKRCPQFNTCGENSDKDETVSYVNRKVFDNFQSMQRNLRAGDCAGSIADKDRIVELMTIPLVQGTLKYAYIKDTQNANEEDAYEGSVFAASVLPYVAACDADAADTIYENMKGEELVADYAATKEAFESVYDCLGITCEEVGGQWAEGDKEYEDGGEPCKSSAEYQIHSIITIAMYVCACIMFMSM